MMDAAGYDGVISMLYETVVDPGAWAQTLAAMRGMFDCSIVSLNTHVDGKELSFSTAPVVSEDWARRWASANPIQTRPMADGDVALARSLCGDLSASAYYNEFLLPADIPQVMIVRGPRSATTGAVVNIMRGRHQAEFEEAELALARRLSRHIVGALRTAAMLGWKSWTELTASLETARDGIVLVDDAGMVLHMNRSARALTEERDGIVVGARRLDAVFPRDKKRLRAAIWEGASAPSPSGAMLAIERPSGARPLIASITPLAVTLVDIGVPRPRALIAILDPECTISSPAADLQRLFGLTRREADVAQALADGLTIAEAAQRCGITLTTARNYLVRVLRKTHVNRQGELVRLLNGLARLADAPRRA